MTDFTNTTFQNTYKDDFVDSDNYHRILFNSSRTLQARELTQLQTIIQTEVSRFGDHVFKDGSLVIPGGLSLDTIEFVKLDGNPDISAFAVGDVITEDVSGVKAKILRIEQYVSSSEPATFYITYTDANGQVPTTSPIRFTPYNSGTGIGVLRKSGASVNVQVTNTTEDPAVGAGTAVSVATGSFYALKHFVQCNPQTVMVAKYSATPTVDIGFKVTESIVTAEDESALYDNQNVLPNETAPGADRYKINLELTTSDVIDSDENFIYLNRLVEGEFLKEIDRSTYNIIGEESALRTFEESGDYIVESLDLDFTPDSDAGLVAELGPGIAYIKGYRFNQQSTLPIKVNKARDFQQIENDTVSAYFGNYLNIDGTTIKGVPNIDVFEVQTLYDNVNLGGANIGTARVRQVEQNGADYKYYLFDVNINPGYKFTAAKSIGTSSTSYGNIITENNAAVLKEADENNLFFDLPRIRPKSFDDIQFIVQRRISGLTTDGSGVETIDVDVSGSEAFTNTTTWIAAFDSDGGHVAPVITLQQVTNANDRAQLDFGPTYANKNFEVLVAVQKSYTPASAVIRSKTITNTTVTTTIDSDGSGILYVPLSKADIYNVTRVTDSDSDGVDLSGFFTLDNGQRDNFYGEGRLILNTGVTAPSGNVFVRYDYFAHGTGHFFGPTSYTGLNLDSIPTYTTKLGEEVELRNVLDFRPRKGDGDTEYSTGTAIVNEIPTNTSLITSDIEYYLPRRDILVLTANNEVEYIEGTSSFNPVYPTTPNDAMKIYEIDLEAYTDDEDDVDFSSIGNIRYTMADIARLEDRIERVEETTTLSLLELNAANIEVLDDSGNNRFKNGFFADNFETNDFVDISTGEFFASFDEDQDLIQPLFTSKSANLFVDSAASSGVTVAGELVMLSYNDSAVISQLVASETENVNPFAIISHVGSIEMVPSVDNWTEVNEVRNGRLIVQPRRVAQRVQLRRRAIASIDWRRTRNGRLAARRRIRRRLPFSLRTIILRNRRNARRIRPLPEVNQQWNVTSTTRRTQAGTTVTTVRERTELSDFIRPRLVFFRARGLRPRSRHFAFFDGTSVTNFVRQESSVNRNSIRRLGGGQFRGSVNHPDGDTVLTSDSAGELIGSFFIPANRFQTGDREFKLIDISVDDEDAALSHASSTYSANGTVITREISTRFIPRPRPRRRRRRSRRRDPLAQSFQLPMETGGFVSKIDVFFKTRPTENIPIRMQIRPMIAGVPSEEFLAETTVFRDEVQIPGDLDDMTTIASSPTSFPFEEPVYLQPETEYCFVLLADTNDYNVYVAKAGDFEIGTTERRIRRQPTLGSMFLSQNSRTWTPDQSRDLMFEIYAASFSTGSTGTAYLRNDDIEPDLLGNNPIFIDSGETDVFIRHPNSGLMKGDTVVIDGLDSNGDYGGITGTSILGNRTVQRVDGYGILITADSAATSSTVTGGDSVTATQNMMFDRVVPNIETFIRPEVSLTLSANFINGVSLSGANEVTQTVGYSASTTNHIFDGNEPIILEAPSMVAGRTLEVTNLGANRSANITASFSTTNKWLSPVIDMQTAELGLFNNIIDDQVDSVGLETALTNAPVSYVAETDPVDGTALAKYVSSNINLEEPAVGLKIFIGANRPSGSNIDVYYKLVSAGEDTAIEDINWVYVSEESNNPTDDDPSVYREYEYLIGGNTGTLDPFSTFKIKVVFRSGNTSKVPRLRDIRAIALGT